MSLVEYACNNQIATLSLNRPDRLNAFSDELVRHLADALRRFDLDPDAQVAVICGNGRAFSSGADVLQRQLRKREEFLEHGGPQGWGANSGDLLTRSVNWKPVIAAPHGYAMGLALGIVLECDLIVAAAGTKFQVTETSRGLGGAKYWALLNFRGAAAFATEVTLTGRFFTAEEALAAGIINASRRKAGTSKSPTSSPRKWRRTRHSRCAQPSAAAAGIWISSSKRLRCRPRP
jgi:enoyl-CoA hydratase/carnithine racemase